MKTAALVQFRKEIDLIDRQLVELLAARFTVVRAVAAHKEANGLAARIPSRIRTVIERNEAAGRAIGLPRRAAANIWKTIVEEACRLEEILMTVFREDTMAKTAKKSAKKKAAKKAVKKKAAKKPAKPKKAAAAKTRKAAKAASSAKTRTTAKAKTQRAAAKRSAAKRPAKSRKAAARKAPARRTKTGIALMPAATVEQAAPAAVNPTPAEPVIQPAMAPEPDPVEGPKPGDSEPS